MEYSSVLTSYFIVIPIVQKCVPKEKKIKHSSWKQQSFLPMVDQQRLM
ncbi:unknown [Prevotella sp. CAG:1185]|nr:unknown [Prevotella sp. CAG:1185]